MTDPPPEEIPLAGEPILVEPPAAIDQEDAFLPIAPDLFEAIDTEDRAVQAAEPPTPSPLIDLSPALRAIAELGGKLGSLQAQFDREIRAEATREKVVDRLHAELQEYKGDMLLNVLRPVFVDLIQLHDDIGRMAASADSDAMKPLFANIQQGLEDILYRQGVEPFESDSPAFDARRQRAVSTVPTDDPSLARTIAARLRKGFATGEKVIRPEIVSVYTLRRAETG